MFNRIAARLHVASWTLTERARGANFLEYALLAGLVIGVIAVARGPLTDAFTRAFGNIANELGRVRSS
jgi:Flp pilus assembly pilin Flp